MAESGASGERARARVAAELARSVGPDDTAVVDRVVPLLYDRLRLLARRQLRRLRPGQTLDTTALVHEAYLRLEAGAAGFRDRNHFLCAAAIAMRHILVDEARRRMAARRGGSERPITLTEVAAGADQKAVGVLDLEQAMEALAARDDRLCRVVELRFYGGMTVQETAAALELSERTVKRDWRKARAFLHRELRRPG